MHCLLHNVTFTYFYNSKIILHKYGEDIDGHKEIGFQKLWNVGLKDKS